MGGIPYVGEQVAMGDDASRVTGEQREKVERLARQPDWLAGLGDLMAGGGRRAGRGARFRFRVQCLPRPIAAVP